MKKYTIKYTDGWNIKIAMVKAESKTEAMFKFYTNYPCVDLLDVIEE